MAWKSPPWSGYVSAWWSTVSAGRLVHSALTEAGERAQAVQDAVEQCRWAGAARTMASRLLPSSPTCWWTGLTCCLTCGHCRKFAHLLVGRAA